MRPLPLHAFQLGASVNLTWTMMGDPAPGVVRRLEARSIGFGVHHPTVAHLRNGDVVLVATDAGMVDLFHARVLHVETSWRTEGAQVVRSPSLLVVTPAADEVEATQHRRFVRIDCDLEVEVEIGSTRRRGRCTSLGTRGLSAEVAGPLPDAAEISVRLLLPSGSSSVHGLLLRNEPVSGTRHRIAVAFTQDQPIDPDLTAFVLRRGYTPIPTCLAS